MAKNYNEYNDLGVRFLYPANWFVRTETWDKGTYSITVDTPDGGFLYAAGNGIVGGTPLENIEAFLNEIITYRV